MSTILTTIRKELVSYFFSPIAYVIAVLFFFFRGLETYALCKVAVIGFWDKEMFVRRYLFQVTTWLMIFLVPAVLTMRCFAEERRTGSMEMLLTAPVRDVDVVIGKWFAALLFFAALWLPTLPLLWILTGSPFLGEGLPVGPVLAGFLGLFLIGALTISVGCFTSSFTDNQLLASLCAIILNLALVLVPVYAGPMLANWTQENYLARTFFEQVNVMSHLQEWFGRGLIETSQIVFYVGGIAFFLFLTTKILGSRRWR